MPQVKHFIKESQNVFDRNVCVECLGHQPSRYCDTCNVACCEECWNSLTVNHERRVCPRCQRHKCLVSSYTLVVGFQELCNDCLVEIEQTLADQIVVEALE